jgi:hypothetical protein
MTSLHLWKMFVNAGYGYQCPHHRAERKFMDKPLTDFLLDIHSPNFAWMVDLELVNLSASTVALKSLSTLINIRSLVIRYGPSSNGDVSAFTDGVIEQWALRSRRCSAFSRLQMVFIQNAPNITARAFGFLKLFPMLDTFCVRGTSIKSKHRPTAAAEGWMIHSE